MNEGLDISAAPRYPIQRCYYCACQDATCPYGRTQTDTSVAQGKGEPPFAPLNGGPKWTRRRVLDHQLGEGNSEPPTLNSHKISELGDPDGKTAAADRQLRIGRSFGESVGRPQPQRRFPKSSSQSRPLHKMVGLVTRAKWENTCLRD